MDDKCDNCKRYEEILYNDNMSLSEAMATALYAPKECKIKGFKENCEKFITSDK